MEGIGVQRGVEALVFYPHSCLILLTVNTSVKNADAALCVLPLPEVLVDPSSLSSQHQLQLQIPASIQPLITPHTFFLLNKSDLVTDILPPALSTTSFSISHQSHQVNTTYPTNVLHLLPLENNALLPLPSTPTSPVEMQNSNTSGSPYHGQAWSTSLVTNQGTHEFVQGLAEALKSRYDFNLLDVT